MLKVFSHPTVLALVGFIPLLIQPEYGTLLVLVIVCSFMILLTLISDEYVERYHKTAQTVAAYCIISVGGVSNLFVYNKSSAVKESTALMDWAVVKATLVMDKIV